MSAQLHRLQRLVCRSGQVHGSQLQLTPEQQHYLQRVLRLRPGDRFVATLSDEAQSWLAQLKVSHEPDTSQAQLLERLPEPSPLPVQIHLLAALPKTGFDDVVRQVTELGVSSITPVLSDRTLLKPSPKKLERWRRIAQEATEQCERADVPVIQAPVTWPAALAQVQAEQKYIAAARAEARHLLSALAGPAEGGIVPGVAIAIGPEGGWTEAEIEQAIAAGCQPVTLGPTILRAVTASPAVVAMIMGRCVDFGSDRS